jgi:hypothetical protein
MGMVTLWIAVLGNPSQAILTIVNADFQSADFFPLLPGTTWTYLKNGSVTAKVKALDKTAVVKDVETVVLQESGDGSKEFYTADAGGIRLHRLFQPDVPIQGLGKVDLALTFIPPIQLAAGTAEIGQTVNTEGIWRTNPLPVVGVVKGPYSASFTLQEFDNVTVPAGNFDVVRLAGTISTSEGSISDTFDLAEGIGIVKATTTFLDLSKTYELVSTNVGVRDLAVTGITAPKTVTLTAKKPVQTKRVIGEIQNRSPHTKMIQDMDMLGNLVSLAVESLGACPAPIPVLHSGPPQKALPLVLKSKQKVNVVFDVTFDCANDSAKSTKKDPGHEDFRYTATVNHAALDGEADTHSEDDICPRDALPSGVDPNPNGAIQDKGCGGRKPDGTLGAEVLTDIIIK